MEAERLESVVEAAERLFASRGFEKTGMRELAAETGVSTATIYARFRSKRRLLAEIVERRLDEAQRAPLVEHLSTHVVRQAHFGHEFQNHVRSASEDGFGADLRPGGFHVTEDVFAARE